MIRPLRIEFAGAVYHITPRGNSKQVIFLHEKDFTDFLGVLGLKVILQNLNPSCPYYFLTAIYLLMERLEGQLKRLFKLRPKGMPKKKVDR